MAPAELTAPSPVAGMGAILAEGGASFRVWAPHADQVFVIGSFNEWAPESHALAAEEGGYWSALVQGVKAGDQYKFRIINGEHELFRIDPYARAVTNSVGEGIVIDLNFPWQQEDYRTPPWNEMVIYELHVGTFNPPADRLPGTFDDAIERLPYLRDLGVNVVELMPPMEFPGGISWGYNPSHPFAVESDYGGPESLKRFVEAAHAHGIAVVLDVVFNHFGPSDLDMWQFDGWSENGKGGIYFYNDWRSATPWGDTRPDYGRPEVRQFIRDNVLMWLEEYHLDGLRFDATAYIRNVIGGEGDGEDLAEGWGLLQWLNAEIDARQPWKITIAEDLRGNAAITGEIAAGGAGFDAQWDAGFVHPVRAAIIAQDDAGRDVAAVAGALTAPYNGDPWSRVIYTESHDEVANGKARVPEEIWPGNAASLYAKKRSTLGAALALTAPGIPMLFQGQEFLSDSWFEDQRPLEWSRLEQFAGIRQLYADLISLRRNMGDLTRGLRGRQLRIFHASQDTKVIAFQRWDNGGPCDDVVVVANFAGEPRAGYVIGLPGPGMWRVRLNSDWGGYDPEFGDTPSGDVAAIEEPHDGLPCRGELLIGPYSVLIMSQDTDLGAEG